MKSIDCLRCFVVAAENGPLSFVPLATRVVRRPTPSPYGAGWEAVRGRWDSACVRAHLLAARSRPLAEAGLIYVLPDDSSALVALQIGSGAVVGLASIVLLAVASLFGLLQGKN